MPKTESTPKHIMTINVTKLKINNDFARDSFFNIRENREPMVNIAIQEYARSFAYHSIFFRTRETLKTIKTHKIRLTIISQL